MRGLGIMTREVSMAKGEEEKEGTEMQSIKEKLGYCDLTQS